MLFRSSFVGAAWVFTRANGAWTQQGTKLVGTGAVLAARQGSAVALSADGNTALIGGPNDNFQTGPVGAVWVFTRASGVWTQQGDKLVGNGMIGDTFHGSAVALSADGNTAIVGGFGDNGLINGGVGAAWIYMRSGNVWSYYGQKLVGAGAVGAAHQGRSVALSADGNTAIIGGPADDGLTGAAWVWTRSQGMWLQRGAKLVGRGVAGQAHVGFSVALSAAADTVLLGGYNDSANTGAAWGFARRAAHDLDGNSSKIGRAHV